MKVVHHYKNFPSDSQTIITIGTFDGVHIGHRAIIKDLVSKAHQKNKKSALLTFFPHPRMVVQPKNSIKLINTIDERIALLEETGLDYLIIQPFDKDFANLTAFEFVRDVLVDSISVSELVIGYDHRFGKNREGDFDQLSEYGHIFDFEVTQIEAQDIDDISISSTKVRNALERGHVDTANQYLTSPYFLSGTIEKGQQLGNTIGYPTANIKVKEDYKLVPKKGAYTIKAKLNNNTYFGMLNIGDRPTVNGTHTTIEAHLFDFDKDIYGETITVEFLHFLRDEQKFNSLNELKSQLLKDKANSLNFLQKSESQA